MKSIKVSVSFKDIEAERELYNYLMEKAKIIRKYVKMMNLLY